MFLKKSEIDKCKDVLLNGELLAFPTETVYGLGCISNSEEAFKKLVSTKKRPPNKPFTMMCSSINQVKNIVEINDLAKKIIKKFMPGPITLILKTKKDVPYYLDLGTGFIGIRIPNDEFVLKLINEVGVPLLVPSANVSSEPPAKCDQEVYNYFKDTVYTVEGKCESGVPSTVIKIDGASFTILREGTVNYENIMEAIKND